MFQFGASARSAARVVRPEMPRRMCRLAVRRHDKRLLQGRRGSEYNAGTNDRMPLELGGQSFQEGVTLHRVDRRCGRLDSAVFVIGKAQGHDSNNRSLPRRASAQAVTGVGKGIRGFLQRKLRRRVAGMGIKASSRPLLTQRCGIDGGAARR